MNSNSFKIAQKTAFEVQKVAITKVKPFYIFPSNHSCKLFRHFYISNLLKQLSCYGVVMSDVIHDVNVRIYSPGSPVVQKLDKSLSSG